MQHTKLWIMAVLIVGGLLAACGQTPAATVSKPEPAEVKPIEGTDLNTVTLIAEAAQRLNIQTTTVREEQVTRKRMVGGEAVTQPGATNASGTTSRVSRSSKLWVRVPLSAGDLATVDRSQPVTILPLAKTADAQGVSAKLDTSSAAATGTESALFYAIEGTSHNLTPGNRVRVELVLAGSGSQRPVIPYSALIYDLHGETWVYTSPAPLTYVRERVEVDYIDGDQAILTKGPSANTEIVSVGVAELYGTEFGVGH